MLVLVEARLVLRHLKLRACSRLTGACVATLASASAMRLVVLHLDKGAEVGPGELAPLGGAPWFRGLRKLTLGHFRNTGEAEIEELVALAVRNRRRAVSRNCCL